MHSSVSQEAEKYGPSVPFCDELHAQKYRSEGESFREAMNRIAATLQDSDEHFHAFRDALLDMRFMPGGRIQAAIGSTKNITALNCFVSGTIADSFVAGDGNIMQRATEAAATMRMGGGIGYDFSGLRPRGANIKKLQSRSSGPISFMDIYDAVCRCTASSGHRRGSQMGILRCDHPDIIEFVHSKNNQTRLTGFNISVAITDEFMAAVIAKKQFALRFDGEIHRFVDANELWETIMRSTWDWAEPGVIFIDQINRMNNLWWCETIAATNPSMPAGTLVHTDTGIKEIEKLDSSYFNVRVLDGTWAKARCFLSSLDAPVYAVDFGSGKLVRATAEHKWPILCNGRYVRVTTSNLKIGDRIPLNCRALPDMQSTNEFTESDGFALGMLFGDGWFGRRKDNGKEYIGYTFNTEQPELADRIVAYWNSRYDLNLHITKPHDNELAVQITGEAASLFLSAMNITNTDKTQFPSIVFSSSDEFIQGFIDGLFSSDSYVDAVGCRIVFTNKSHAFCSAVGKLLAFCGIKVQILDGITKLNCKEFARTDLYIQGPHIETFANLFKYTCIDKQTALDTAVRKKSGQRGKSAEYVRHECVKSIALVSAGEPVWDIAVENEQHVFPTEWVTTGNCGEQLLPPFGACLLGSFNLVKYVRSDDGGKTKFFDWNKFEHDIPHVVRAMDNVVDKSIYPLPEQAAEQKSKRRMGIGITGLANALEALGMHYGGAEFIEWEEQILRFLTNQCYKASALLAMEKGSFPLYDADKYLRGNFIRSLNPSTLDLIAKYGIRNSHLTSVAPTGTISLCADNISSSIEPLFDYEFDRTVIEFEGPRRETIQDYGVRTFGIQGIRSKDVTAKQHVDVLIAAQKYIDSACSKTCNVGPDVTWEDFKHIYMDAWQRGAKGCSTFRANGKRRGVLESKPEAQSCEVINGTRSCE